MSEWILPSFDFDRGYSAYFVSANYCAIAAATPAPVPCLTASRRSRRELMRD